VTKLYSIWNKASAERNREQDTAVGKTSIYRSAHKYMKWSVSNCHKEIA